ncbi:MAG: aspartate/glutamate racemase family protein [Bacteroidota bacterium]
MKTLGLIGGMSWESSHVYYELINKKVREILGGFHSCKSIMLTVDFAEIEKLQHTGDWDALDREMAAAAASLEKAGADLIILCTNTMHLCSEAIVNHISVPFLHIAEATAMEIKNKKLNKVALLGTRFTMEKDFYKKILLDKYGIDVIIPEKEERDFIHRTIYEELVHGILKDDSRKAIKKIIENLEKKGAQGAVLGCTEIPLLIKSKDVQIPIFNTMEIHAAKAVEIIMVN